MLNQIHLLFSTISSAKFINSKSSDFLNINDMNMMAIIIDAEQIKNEFVYSEKVLASRKKNIEFKKFIQQKIEKLTNTRPFSNG